MWRPNDVVAGHRRRAVVLWMLMIFGILAYASWLLDTTVRKRDHPSTYRVTSNTIYAYPDVWVCLYNTYGCDELELEEQCLDSSTLTEGEKPSAVFYPGGEYEQEFAGVGKLTESNGWCLEFKTSEVTTFKGEEPNPMNYLDYIILNASWFPGGSAGASTTCVPDGDEWKNHREWVYIYLHDPVTDTSSAGIPISYSCVTSESDSHVFTYMGMGLNEQRNIKKEDAAVYKALTLVSSVYKDKGNGNVTNPYAHVEVQMQQEVDSCEVVTEIDPLNVGEILGSIGGFWDLILILWPIFFVAATRQGPHQKPRSFKKSAETTVAGVPGFRGGTASRQGPSKHTVPCCDQCVRPSDCTEQQQIEQPHWGTIPPSTHAV